MRCFVWFVEQGRLTINRQREQKKHGTKGKEKIVRMLKRLIVFLIRRKLGVKKYEGFRFTNQKGNAVYWFTSEGLFKSESYFTTMSKVSLNWLLDDECEVKKV